jgi:hypothetical protein
MTKRQPISKKLRFEVFKRDGFKCQYCGKSAPDIVLHVDHINPVKRGGKNDIMNLITSCLECNLGKGARTIDDKSIVERQCQQLQELTERREQLRMMTKWRDEMISLEEEQINYINRRIDELTGHSLNEIGKNDMRKTVKKYGFDMTLEALEKSAIQYLQYDKNDKLVVSSVDKFVSYIPRICNGIKIEQNNPEVKELAYICGIARNRFSYYDKQKAWEIVNRCYQAGIGINAMNHLAKNARNWSEFYYTLEEWAGR